MKCPGSRVVERRGLRFTVYPTLRDRGEGVELTEATSAAEADESLRAAVLRLAMLALPEQFKYARKRFAERRELVLLGQGRTRRPLAESLTERAFSDVSSARTRRCRARRQQFQALLDRVARLRRGRRSRAAHALETCASCATCGRSWRRSTLLPSSKRRKTRMRSCKTLLPADFPTACRPSCGRTCRAISRRSRVGSTRRRAIRSATRS